MKIGILSAMWQRPEVFEIFATGINRLQGQFDIIPVIVGSEGEASRELCRKYQFMYLERPNNPLGRKFNEGLRVFRGTDVDYVMVMGSDDIISNNLIEAYMPYMEKRKDIIGILDIYFYDMIKKEMHYLPGYGLRKQDKHRKGEPLGLARCLSRDLIDKCHWQLWQNSVDKGLDWTMWMKLKRMRVRPVTLRLTDINALALDLKSGHNICGLNIYRTQIVNDDILNMLSDEEIEMIRNYGNTVLS